MSTIFNENYHFDKLKRKDLMYRFKKRTSIMIRELKKNKPKVILDLGTADGMAIELFKKYFPRSLIIGSDASFKVLNICKSSNKIICNAENLPFKDNSINAITAAALIEHLEKPEVFIKELKRVLKKGGIAVLTTPKPLFEKIAKMIGYLKDDIHKKTFNLKELEHLFKSENFKVLTKECFMISPFFRVPFEDRIEHFLNKIKLNQLMVNQLVTVIK